MSETTKEQFEAGDWAQDDRMAKSAQFWDRVEAAVNRMTNEEFAAGVRTSALLDCVREGRKLAAATKSLLDFMGPPEDWNEHVVQAAAYRALGIDPAEYGVSDE